jgi:Na+-translocating ferredoxin:NAD+ oxidoreductase RnfG subunit
LCWRASNIGIFGLLINQLFALMGFDGLLAGLAYTTLQNQLQQQQQQQQQEEFQQVSVEANEGDKGGIGAVIKRLENSASVR